MKVELYLNSAAETTAFAEFLPKLAAVRVEQERKQDEWNAKHGDPFSGDSAPVTTTAIEVEETKPAPEKAERKPRQKKEKVETEPNPAPGDTTIPEPAEPAPAAAAKPTIVPEADAGFDQKTLEDMTRSLAKTNYPAAKKLLDEFGVKRFGELPKDKYQAYGSALAAL